MFIPIMLGIIAGYYYANQLSPVFRLLAIAAFSMAIAAAFLNKPKPLLSSVLLQLCLVVAGCLLMLMHTLSMSPGYIEKWYANGQTIVATLTEPPVPKSKSVKAEATVQLLTSEGKLRNTEGKIIMYLSKSESMPALEYGSVIAFRKPLQHISNAGNPGSFNYKAYAERQGIFYQAFLKDHEYEVLAYRNANAFLSITFNTRDWVLRQIIRYIPDPAENGVAQALLIGYRGDLDKALVEQYANTGVVHIIAISGMHLGMIYGLLIFLLQPLGQKRSMIVVRLAIMLGSIWIFTLLTGAAPSITRAAIMFTMVSAGQALHKNASIYNSLAAAAILLLIINPYSLWDVGFQLSFSAVLSIAVFYQPIQKWWSPKNILVKKVWQLIAVTIAAQILTMPMAVYHFHQFPLYFLLSNLVAVPLSGFALYALLALLGLSWWPAAAVLAGWVAGTAIRWLNTFILWVNELPFTTLSHIQISIPQALLLYATLFSLCWWWFYKSKPGLVMAFSSIMLFTLGQTRQLADASQQHRLVIYNVPQYTAIDYIAGRQSTFIGDTAIAQPGFLQNFHLLPSRILMQFKPSANLLLDTTNNFTLNLAGKKITLLRRQLDYRRSKPVQTNILLVSGNPPGNPYKILSLIKCDEVVLDGSNSAGRIARWKSAADSLHLRLHSVPHDGAFVVNLAGTQPERP